MGNSLITNNKFNYKGIFCSKSMACTVFWITYMRGFEIKDRSILQSYFLFLFPPTLYAQFPYTEVWKQIFIHKNELAAYVVGKGYFAQIFKKCATCTLCKENVCTLYATFKVVTFSLSLSLCCITTSPPLRSGQDLKHTLQRQKSITTTRDLCHIIFWIIHKLMIQALTCGLE